jgi:hypothetical protein
MLAAYQAFAQDPCIDTTQVYVFSLSAEAIYVSAMLEKSPGLWKGAILITPSAYPDFSKSSPWQPRPKILATMGSEWHGEDQFKKFQAEGLNSGTIAELVVFPGEWHSLVGNLAHLNKARAITHFIFEE